MIICGVAEEEEEEAVPPLPELPPPIAGAAGFGVVGTVSQA